MDCPEDCAIVIECGDASCDEGEDYMTCPEDCEECESTLGKIDIIDREITLEGDLDDAQRQKLMDIAERCPVHRTLTSENVIRDRLGDQAQSVGD